MPLDLSNVVPFVNMTKELFDEVARIKKVRGQLTPGSEPFNRIDKLLQQTLKRGY